MSGRVGQVNVILPLALVFIAACWLWFLLKGPNYWKRRFELDRKALQTLRRERRLITPEEAAAILKGDEPADSDRETDVP